MERNAVVVLSGGLDSTTCMGIARDRGYRLYAITFQYGQRHSREVEQAKKISEHFQVVEHKIVDMGFLNQIGGSALTDTKIEIRTGSVAQDIPVTYVPARNMIFLSLATAYAEVIGADTIFVGVSSVDYSGYPDCRPEFIRSMEKTANLATKMGTTGNPIKIEAPLLHMTKGETIKLGLKLNVPYHLTTSCYQGGKTACGVCDSCLLRLRGFKEAGIEDPIDYKTK